MIETKPLQMAIGVTTIAYEIRRENGATMFGCRVNGEFRETCRLVPNEPVYTSLSHDRSETSS